MQTEINAIDPAFSLLLGDNVYFSGTHAEYDLRLDPSINAPLTTYNKTHIDYFSFGNHDEGCNSGQAAHENYSMPIPVQGATSPVGLAFDADVEAEENYSFDYGSLHFVPFDTNNWTNPEALDKQLDWAVADITAARARVNPPDWVIVFGHHPITSLGGHSEHNAETYYYHQVLSRLGHGAGGVGVDLLLAGHTHNYQRSYPLTGHQEATVTYVLDTDNYYAKGSGLPLVVQGTGGISLGYGADDAIYSGTYLAKAMDSNTSVPAEFGFGKVNVSADDLTYTYINSLGQVLDSFSIGTPPPDVTPPEATLAAPLDNGFSDLDPAPNQVTVSTLPAVLRIQLSDIEQGIDDNTVLPTSVFVTRNSIALVEGVDYAFAYSSATDEITLSPLPAMGLFFGDGTYSISLASTIEDQASNPLPPTILDIVADTTLPAIVAFQQGLEGYTGTLDTYVQQDEPSISHGSYSKLNADGYDDLAPSDTEAQEVQGLIRFNDLFSSGGSASRTGGPIPDGAHILNATLQVRTGTESGDVSAATFNLHRVLADWGESDTWDSMVLSGLGIARDDIEASASATATVSGGNVNVAGGWVSFVVTADLQLWSSNHSLDLYGWLIHPDTVELGGDPVAGQTDGWWFDSSEAEIEANRPVLIVNYVPPPSNVNPGGPYVIQEGNSLALNGSATGVGPLTYEWDLNGDGIFGDASGTAPVLSWAQLVTLGLTDGLLVRNLAARVSDSFGQQVNSTMVSPTTLTLSNAAPTASISGTTDIYRGETVTFTLAANDPSPV